ncbi:MAG: exopolysaccharide biosynthesis protein [Hyphomonadaceae bacterium]|nr:exopolysaccharide biosynthesis protein [Hyphomonadaceae bacterium]
MVGPTTSQASHARAARKAPKQNLQSLLDELCGLVDCGLNPLAKDAVTLRELLGAVGRRSYGPLLLVIGLFSISPATVVPGMTWLSAGLTLVVALQMALGMQRPWLPKGALDRSISRDLVVKGVNGFRPWARRIDSFLKPRLTFLAAAPFVNLIALLCAAAALITIPLGFIPFAPIAPGLVIVIFGLGMTARDGLLLLLGVAGVAGTAALSWPLISRVLEQASRMLA